MAHGTPICGGRRGQRAARPAPFILEAGISSSYRIAAFWGLAGEGTGQVIHRTGALRAGNGARAEATPLAAVNGDGPEAPRRAAAPSPRPTSQPGGFDPQTIIDKALRKAGLLRK